MNDVVVKAPALTVAYVVKGFFERAETIDASGTTLEVLAREAGELAMVDRLCALADLVEAAWLALPENSFAGVWEYEVSEEFGRLLFEYAKGHMKLPTNDEAPQLVASVVECARAAHGED